MQTVLVIIAALIPVAVLIWRIYSKDKLQPEPTSLLVKAFFFGIISLFLSLVFSVPLSLISNIPISQDTCYSISTAFTKAFLYAAIPEEAAKLIMLWLLLRKNPFFDEKFDGIVYAVCTGMGFAALENIIYLLNGLESGSWIGLGIARALFSVPGHYLFAVIMGYYYSIYHFGIDRSLKARIMILAAPVIAHGLYDGILFCITVDESLALVCVIAFLFFFNALRIKGREKINNLINQ